MHTIIKGIHDVLLNNDFKNTKILYVGEGDTMIKCILLLPPKKDVNSLIELLPNLKEQVNANDAKIGEQHGKKVEVLFGKSDLSKVPFKINMINKNSLKVTFMSAFGRKTIDFMDGASCHLLNGGRTRMGKTTFVLYLLTSLYFQNKGKIKLYISSSKISDFYPFEDLPNVEFAEDEDSMRAILQQVLNEYEDRRKLLKTKEYRQCVDAKGLMKKFPHKRYLMQPVFLMIDEYADYSKIPDIQNDIKTIVRKAGYVNIHVIVCTQRADARATIPPEVKANLGARICFSTTDQANSLNILDTEGAERLGGIEGRAILLDGDKSIIQVPYMSYEQCNRMLKPFRKSVSSDSEGDRCGAYGGVRDVNESGERQQNNGLSEKIQDMFKESALRTGIQREQQPHNNMQQGNEKTMSGWYRL